MIDRNDLNHSGYVTAAWVKQRYKISNSTLYKWISDKHLAAPVKIGPRAVRFRLQDINEFEAKRSANATAC